MPGAAENEEESKADQHKKKFEKKNETEILPTTRMFQ
jgi:hypothetical protein